jgi:hypothetical protein
LKSPVTTHPRKIRNVPRLIPGFFARSLIRSIALTPPNKKPPGDVGGFFHDG